MAGYILIGRIQEKGDPDPIGIAHLNDDECQAVTSFAIGPKKGITFKGIESHEYDTLLAVDVPVWTCKQIIGTEPEPDLLV